MSYNLNFYIVVLIICNTCIRIKLCGTCFKLRVSMYLCVKIHYLN